MFIDLLDHLRCPRQHTDSWLVAAVEGMEGRYVARGTLGCPVCRGQYPIRDFVGYFDDPVGDAADGWWLPAATGEQVTRLAALCGLTEPGGFVALTSQWAALAAPLALSFDVQCVVIDPTGRTRPGDGISVICARHVVPLAPGCLRAAALDATGVDVASSLVRAVRPGGRVVAPVGVPLPDGVHEIARDEHEWVGEREPETGPLIPLGRNPR